MPPTLIMEKTFLSLINKNYFVNKTDYCPLRREILFKLFYIFLNYKYILAHFNKSDFAQDNSC